MMVCFKIVPSLYQVQIFIIYIYVSTKLVLFRSVINFALMYTLANFNGSNTSDLSASTIVFHMHFKNEDYIAIFIRNLSRQKTV